jgi:hypothetical protein
VHYSTLIRSLALVAATVLVDGCGRTNDSSALGTGDGDPNGGTGRSHGGASAGDADAGSGEPGSSGNVGSAGAGGTSAVGVGGSAVSFDGGIAGTGGAAGGAGGAFMGSAGTPDNPFPIVGTGEPVDCKVPDVPVGDTPEAKERTTLIERHCSVLADYPCLTNSTGEASRYAATCGAKARVAACELDDVIEYNLSIPPACDDEWHASVACANAVDYSGACEDGGAEQFPLGIIQIQQFQSPAYTGEPCRPERQAIEDCIEKENPYTITKGKRAECNYHTAANDPAICQVYCAVGTNQFESSCDGVAGGPFECGCSLNGVPLSDDAFGYNPRFFGASCGDIAQSMSDGECIKRVDCCFTWQGVQGKEGCACVSDPKLVGYDTCAAAAAATAGKVVDLCPVYAPFSGGLNIERSN